MRLFGNPLELVILDVDGVIVELGGYFEQTMITVANQLGIETARIPQYFRDMHNGLIKDDTTLAGNVKALWPELADERFIERFKDLFCEDEKRNPYPLIQGSLETIVWLKRCGVPVALCTGNDSVNLARKLEATKVSFCLFDAISTSSHGYEKPDPRVLDPVFEKIRVSKLHAVYVGDWFVDHGTAKNAGVRFIAVLSGGTVREAFCAEGVRDDHIIDRLADFPRLVQA